MKLTTLSQSMINYSGLKALIRMNKKLKLAIKLSVLLGFSIYSISFYHQAMLTLEKGKAEFLYRIANSNKQAKEASYLNHQKALINNSNTDVLILVNYQGTT